MKRPHGQKPEGTGKYGVEWPYSHLADPAHNASRASACHSSILSLRRTLRSNSYQDDRQHGKPAVIDDGDLVSISSHCRASRPIVYTTPQPTHPAVQRFPAPSTGDLSQDGRYVWRAVHRLVWTGMNLQIISGWRTGNWLDYSPAFNQFVAHSFV